MSPSSWLCVLSQLAQLSLIMTSACPVVNYKLRSNIVPLQGTVCSTVIQDISTPVKKVNLLNEKGSIGIYVRNDSYGQLCHYQNVGSGLVPLNNLTGGTFYAMGKF